MKLGAALKIKFYPGHLLKTFTSFFGDFVKNYKSFTYFDGEDYIEVEHPFEEVSKHIIHWFNIFLNEENDDERVSMWLSTIDHLLWKHGNCKHDENTIFGLRESITSY